MFQTATGNTSGIFPPGTNLPKTNYFPNAGALGNTTNPTFSPYKGPFCNGETVSVGNIADGTSNTIAFNEGLGGSTPGPRNHVVAWMGNSSLVTAWGVIDPSIRVSLGSRHTSVANVGMLDGSVRSVRKMGSVTPWYSAQWYVLQRAAGYQDGEIYDPSQL
jgi:prepilin-type processing-associated H-X9-DG protein